MTTAKARRAAKAPTPAAAQLKAVAPVAAAPAPVAVAPSPLASSATLAPAASAAVAPEPLRAPVAVAPVAPVAPSPLASVAPTRAPSAEDLLALDDLFSLPDPRSLPSGAPTAPARPPGLVPPGDSRSLRRGDLFALVYRTRSFVVTRHGRLGQLGHWSAVEYPTPSAASNAYARACSHWVSEGFLDYRG
ncbi:MAG: hypothetical protein R3B48_28590 [Kofleriaceae bacterium]